MNSPVWTSLKYQAITLLPTAWVLMYLDRTLVSSYLLGALVFILPNLYFIIYAFRYQGANASLWVIKSFSQGEYGKLVLSGLGFALVYRFNQALHIQSFFAGFACMIALQWLIAARICAAIPCKPVEQALEH